MRIAVIVLVVVNAAEVPAMRMLLFSEFGAVKAHETVLAPGV